MALRINPANPPFFELHLSRQRRFGTLLAWLGFISAPRLNFPQGLWRSEPNLLDECLDCLGAVWARPVALLRDGLGKAAHTILTSRPAGILLRVLFVPTTS